MFFALTSAVLCLAIVVIYGISISSIGFLARIFFPLARTVAYDMIVVGSIGTVIGLFATIFSCLTCCAGPATPEDSVSFLFKTFKLLKFIRGLLEVHVKKRIAGK